MENFPDANHLRRMHQETPATADPADPIEQLPRAVYRCIIADLHACILPPGLSDHELVAERIRAAIAELASMVPVNADESNIALRAVIADAQAKDCIRLAKMPGNDTRLVLRCQAQASYCERTANAARALLLRVQSERHKREAVKQSCVQDAWTIHVTESCLLAADGQRVDPPPAPPPSAPLEDTGEPRHTEAELYAIMYPHRAAAIRACGGMPPDARFDRPTPELLGELLASTSHIIQQIDQEYAARPPG